MMVMHWWRWWYGSIRQYGDAVAFVMRVDRHYLTFVAWLLLQCDGDVDMHPTPPPTFTTPPPAPTSPLPPPTPLWTRWWWRFPYIQVFAFVVAGGLPFCYDTGDCWHLLVLCCTLVPVLVYIYIVTPLTLPLRYTFACWPLTGTTFPASIVLCCC